MKASKIISKRSGLRRLNNGLSLVVISLAIYIFVWPFLPKLEWKVAHLSPQPSASQLIHNLAKTTPKVIPKDNTLVIPRLDMTQIINEGPDISALRKGIWRRPKTSTPERGGNTVIVGHRFTYSGKSVFYNLDQVRLDDPLVIYWGGKEYDYTVTNIRVVAATEISVEDRTPDDRLTLYTCTPLWSPTERLVITATKLERSAE